MRCVLLVACGLAAVLALDPRPFSEMSDAAIHYAAELARKNPNPPAGYLQIQKPSNDAYEWSQCVDTVFNSAQHAFNTAVGIDPALDYRNGSALVKALRPLLEQNYQNLTRVCNDYTFYLYQGLGTSYYSCMDFFRLIGTKGVNFKDAYEYSALFQRMQFFCNAGSEEIARDTTCLFTIEHNANFQNCVNTFVNTVNTDPSKLCPSVNTAMGCLNNVYTQTCLRNEAGWYGCEVFRAGFVNSCWGLRCNVGGGN